jgi:uncharacterized protein (TIGR03000 family)
MSLPLFRTICVSALALLGLSLTSEAAFAQQQGWPFQENYGRPTNTTRVIRSAAPRYTVTTPVLAPANTGTIQIDLQVPSEAKVYFNGSATQQTGMSRSFVGSSLTPGFQYGYAVRVVWQEGGRLVEQTRAISFMAGDHVSLDFTKSAQTASR